MRSLICFAMLCLTAAVACAAEPSFSFSDGALTIRTERYETEWRDGSMVRLRSFLPKETEWTLPAGTMNVEQLPNGLGSFHEQAEEGKKQHHGWGTFALTTTFPAQHPPCTESVVKFERNGNVARLIYSGLKGDKDAVLTQELMVEEGTGDLVIRQRGTSANPGVFGVAFSMLNLKPTIELAVPYFGGQRWGADFRKGKITCIAWPQFWNAGLVIGAAPSGAIFAVWADDPEMRPKYFRRYNGANVQAIGFEACNDASYDDTKEIEAFPWRFNVFGKSWMEPAQRYKEWMVKTHGMVPRRERGSRWADDIALIWPAFRDEDAMKKMADVMDPKKTLIGAWGWLKGFNRRIPEYIPQNETFAEDVALAHRHGYHVGVYTSLALIDQETYPTMMKEYGLEYFYRGLWQDRPTEVKSWLVYVHPGSSKWRAFYADKMAEVVRKYGVDYLYQDVTGCAVGSSGLVEGKTFSAAVVACEKAIREKLPTTALGGEYWTEVNACQEDFGIQSFLSWGGKADRELISRPHQPHPLLSYLFHEYCVHWSHAVMVRDTDKFHRNENINEVIGALPIWSTTPEDRIAEAKVVQSKAQLWAEGFRPYFPGEWDPKVVSYMRAGSGRIVKYVRPEDNTFCYEETKDGDTLRYARVTGLRQVALPEPAHIDGWIAYGPNGPIGLDPEQWYCAFPGRPDDLPLRLTRLPDGASIIGVRITKDFCLVEVNGAGTGEIEWEAKKPFLNLYTPTGTHRPDTRKVRTDLPTALLFAYREPEQITPPAPLPLDQWQQNLICSGRIEGAGDPLDKRRTKLDEDEHLGYRIAPPLGGKGSEHSIDGFVALPKDTPVDLKAHAGQWGGSGDGVHFVVRVNGKEIWRQFRETKKGWQEVNISLKDYAGQTVVLSLAVDCGPSGFNTSCDTAFWGNPTLVGGQ